MKCCAQPYSWLYKTGDMTLTVFYSTSEGETYGTFTDIMKAVEDTTIQFSSENRRDHGAEETTRREE
jgi:hypothetical protein